MPQPQQPNYYINGQYQAGLDPRPADQLTPQELALRSGVPPSVSNPVSNPVPNSPLPSSPAPGPTTASNSQNQYRYLPDGTAVSPSDPRYATAGSQPPQSPQNQVQTQKPVDTSSGNNVQPGAVSGATEASTGASQSYTGPSIVDYLHSVNQPSDFVSRAKLAEVAGIQNYTGTAQQNTQLLNTLRQPKQTQQQETGTGGANTGGTQSSTDSGFADKSSGTGVSNTGPTNPAVVPKDFIQVYGDIIKSLGLTDIKEEFKKAVDQEAKITKQLQDEIGVVNDDPWLTTGIRSKQIEKIQNKYKINLEIALHKQQLYDSLYKEGVQQAEFMATGEYRQQQDAALLAEKRIEAARFLRKRYGPGIIGEYEYAKEQGYKGTFSQYQNEDANRKRSNSIFSGGSIVDTVDSMAQALLRGDLAPSQLPGFGQNSLRAQVLARAYKINPQFDAATAEKQYAFGKATKTQLVISMGKTALQTIDRAIVSSNAVDRTQLSYLNNLVVGTKRALGDPKTAVFITDINALGDEIGTVLGQGSATDFKTQLGLIIADKSLSKEQFAASLNELGALFRNRINGVLNQSGQPSLDQNSALDYQSYLKSIGQ